MSGSRGEALCRRGISSCLRKSVSMIVGALLVSGLTFLSQAAEHSRTETFSAVHLNYGDVASLVSRIHEFVAIANAQAPAAVYHEEEATVGGKLSQVRLKNDFSPRAFSEAPQEAYSLRFSYRRDSAPISGVDISLNDYRRVAQVPVFGTWVLGSLYFRFLITDR
jgi:hypothetical protein